MFVGCPKAQSCQLLEKFFFRSLPICLATVGRKQIELYCVRIHAYVKINEVLFEFFFSLLLFLLFHRLLYHANMWNNFLCNECVCVCVFDESKMLL